MRFLTTYGRVIRLLGRDLRIAAMLSFANLMVAGLQFLDPVLFGRVIDLLSRATAMPPAALWHRAASLLGIWGAVGAAGIGANIAVAVQTERLAHRNRLKAMARYYEHVLNLPLSFHGHTQSGRLMKSMISGTDGLFGVWLVFFRDQLSTFISVIVLLPLTLLMNWRLALVLIVLVLVFIAVTSLVIRRTEAGQRQVERHNSSLAGAAQDALANVVVVQSFTRLSAETRLFGDIAREVIRHQFPVLNWWALVNVLTRASSTVAVISIVVIGTLLHLRGQAEVGEIVSFMGFATLLIGRLESAVSFVASLFFRMPSIDEFFAVMDAKGSVPEKPGAPALVVRAGEVAFEGVSFGYPGGPPILNDVSFIARPGCSTALVGQTGAGKSTTMALLQRLWDVRWARLHRRAEPARRDAGEPACGDRRGLPRKHAVQPHHRRQPAHRPPRRQRRGAGARLPDGRRARVHHAPEARLPDDDRRARHDAFRWAAPAAGDRPRAAEGPADPDPGRGD
jgi:ATP-binding cassette subfamily B protein